MCDRPLSTSTKFTTKSKMTKTKNSAILDQFDTEIVESNKLPYCQIQNPPNISLSQIEKMNSPWGWFIPSEQAEQAEFNLPDYWTPTRLSFGEDTPNPRHIDGFLTRKIKVVVLHQSNIEVQEKADNGWRYIGLAYKSGQLTPEGQLAEDERLNYRKRTRYLLFFLNDKNELLHPEPIKIGMNAGVGAAFNGELKEFRTEIEAIFFAQRGEKQQQLSTRAHSLTIFDAEFGLHKTEGKSPYIYPCIRSTPDKSNTITRRERQVELKHLPLEQLVILGKSDTGKIILDAWEEQQDFSSMYQDNLANSVNSDDHLFAISLNSLQIFYLAS